MNEAEERSAVVDEAWSWLHTPYHHLARVKGVGVDCLMVLCEVFERCGLVPHIDPGRYAHDWHLHRNEETYLAGLERYAKRVEGRDPLPGDIAMFRFGRTFSHGGVVVEVGASARDAVVVHSYIGRGVIASRLREEPLDGRPLQLWSIW